MSGLRQLLDAYALGNLTRLPPLHTMAGLSAREAAAFCRIPWETYRRYLADRTPPPLLLQTLTLRAGWVPWPGWDSFLFCATDGRLYHDDLRYGFTPQDLLSLHWLRQELDWRRREAGQQGANDAEPRHLPAGNGIALVEGVEGLSFTPKAWRDPLPEAAERLDPREIRGSYPERDKPKADGGSLRSPPPPRGAAVDLNGIRPRIHYAHLPLHRLRYWPCLRLLRHCVRRLPKPLPSPTA